MKLVYLFIDGYKNLHNIEFFFESDSTVNAIIGNNGSGKSNVLEALTIIFAAKYNNEPVPFTFDIIYAVNDNQYRISNKEGEVFLKGDKVVAKKDQQNSLPRGLFLYYCGETDRLKSMALSYVDRVFNKALKNDNEVTIKYITYAGLREFPPAILANAAYKNRTYEKVCDLIGIEDIGAPIVFHFRRPTAWGKTAPVETFWNAVGSVAAIIGKLLEVGEKRVIDKDSIDISFRQLRDVKCGSVNPFELFIMYELLMQADILEQISFDIIKDGVTISISELSEGEKQLAQLLCLLEATKEHRALFLLDEFDSFLHPSWQRKFSEIISEIDISGQVILTTHSPLTLGKMKKENIRILKDGEVYSPSADTYNRDITEVLEEIMEVGKRPVDVDKAIRDFRNAAVHGNVDSAIIHLETLKHLLSPEDPFWVTAEHFMARLER